MRFAMNRFPVLSCLTVLALAAVPSAASAQYIGEAPPPPAAPIPGMVENPSAALARNVRLLALSPRSFEALIGAGRAALRLGDTQTAVGFFGRAEEVSPRSFAPKAGMAASLVAMEQPTEALGYFEEAVRLGANQASIGADRGLAYDLTGEPAKAQADYRAAFYGPDADEARRRLALSLAMGHDRAGALAAIAPLMARRDPATERVRAFVLAMVGDVAGAKQVVETAMPGASANMAPFLYKLARMSPDQQVAAVHFGRFPDDSAIKLAVVTPSPFAAKTPGPPTAAAPRSAPPATTRQQVPGPSKSTATQSQRTFYVPFDTRARTIVTRPATAAPTAAKPAVSAPIATPDKPVVAPFLAQQQRSMAASEVPEPLTPVTREVQGPPPPATQPKPVEVAAVTSTPAADRLSDIDRLLETSDEPIVQMPAASQVDDAAEADVPTPAKPKAEKASRKGKKVEDLVEETLGKKAKSAKPKSPGKYWVQLAGGAKSERMPIEYKRIKGKKPALFAKRTPYVAELKGWTRLLVGPFKSEDESQEYVNQLAKADIDGFSWTSPTGQTIEKLSPK
jgi:Flp pilus assembly protein TadD